MKSRLLPLIGSVVIGAILVACGGGGGGGSSSTTTSAAPIASTSYQAGVTIGDNGLLCLNTNTSAVPATSACPALNALSYTLTITNSSYGLTGKTFSGAVTTNADGSYHIVGTTNGTLFVYPNYVITVIKITSQTAPNYYSANPNITQDIYVPVIAFKQNSLITTVDGITSSNASLEFRSASMGLSVAGGITTYSSEASRGLITKISNTSFSVASCSNNGVSAQNTNLTNVNCVGGLVTTKTYSYDSASGSWLVTPVDPAHPSQTIRAYFVQDVMTSSVVGYIDTSDSTMTSSKFGFISIVPANTVQPNFGGPTQTFTSYQLCSSDSNCAGNSGEQGIDKNPSVALSNSATTLRSTYMTDGPCDYIVTPNGIVNGFMPAVYTGGPGVCTASGDRPDTIEFFIGSTTNANGKSVTIGVMPGYDPTVNIGPSQKIGINFIVQN